MLPKPFQPPDQFPSDGSKPRWRVALADRHALVRDAVKRIITGQGDMEVVDEASDGAGACACNRRSEPDVILMELTMNGVDGVEATREIKQARPAVKVVCLSAVKNPAFIREFFAAGGDGYLFKNGSAEELVNALRAVQHGLVYPSPEIRSQLNRDSGSERLTVRETQLLRLVATGFSNKEIAARLDLSTKTVETIKARAMQKAGLDSRVEVVRYGAERGWLTPE